MTFSKWRNYDEGITLSWIYLKKKKKKKLSWFTVFQACQIPLLLAKDMKINIIVLMVTSGNPNLLLFIHFYEMFIFFPVLCFIY